MKTILLYCFLLIPFLGFTQDIKNDTITNYEVNRGVLTGSNKSYIVFISKSTINNLSYITLNKYDIQLNQSVWTKEICRAANSNPDHLQTTSDGGYVMTTREYIKASNSTNDLLIKTDSEGNILWRANLNEHNISLPNRGYWEWGNNLFSIAETENGGIIVAGSGILFCTNAKGEVQWKKHSPEIIYKKIRRTKDNNFLLVGQFKTGSSIYSDMLATKVDEHGNELWKRVDDYDGGSDVVNTFVELENGEFLLTGTVEDMSTEQNTGMLTKIQPDGEIVWQKTNNQLTWCSILEGASVNGYFYTTNSSSLFILDAAGNVVDETYIGGISAEVSELIISPTEVTVAGFRYGRILKMYTSKIGANHKFCDITASIKSSGPLTIYWGESVILDAGEGFASYKWSTGETTRTITVSTEGQYSVEVANLNGCTYKTNPLTVTAQCNISTTITSDRSLTINKGEFVTLDAGAGFTSYLWSNGATTRTIKVGQTGHYSVKVKNEFDCYYTTEPVTVTANCNISTSITSDKTLNIFYGETVTLDAGAGFKNYTWNTGETTRTITVNKAGQYDVIVTDEYGCTFKTPSVTITTSCNINTTITSDKPLTINAGETVTLDAGDGFAAYRWNTGETTRTITVSQGGQYSVIVTDSYNCSFTAAPVYVNLICNIQASIVASGAVDLCPGQMVTLDAGEGFTTYRWSTGETTRTITVSNSGQYDVTVSDKYNCSYTTEPVQVKVSAPYTADQICYVTVDEAIGLNKIVWNKTPDKNTIAYNIYKNEVGGAIKIASVAFEEPSIIIDNSSQPKSRSETYFIKAVDKCNNESSQTNYHRTVLLQASLGTAGEVNLNWNRYVGASAYKTIIYRGKDHSNLTPIAELTGQEDRYIDRSPTSDENIYRIGVELNSKCGQETAGGRMSDAAENVLILSNTLNLQVNSIDDDYETGSRSVTIWPNPIANDATIEIDQKETRPVNLQILNITGKLVRQQDVSGYSMTFKRGNLPAGVYIIAITLKNGNTLKKKIVLF